MTKISVRSYIYAAPVGPPRGGAWVLRYNITLGVVWVGLGRSVVTR